MKRRYWIALGEHGAFTRDDHYVMQVFFTGQPGDKSRGLTPKFIEADDFEQARQRLHAFVDEMIDHEVHAIHLDEFARAARQKRAEFLAKEKLSDDAVDSISIGEFVGGKEPKRSSSGPTDGLLDLGDLA